MEDSLTVDVAGSYVGLRQQLCTHKVVLDKQTASVKHLRMDRDVTLSPPDVSALSDGAVHRSPDPSLSYRRGPEPAAERRGGGPVRSN